MTCRSYWNCFIQTHNITVQNSDLRLCFVVSFYGPEDEFRNIHWAHIYRVLLFSDYYLSSLPATIPPQSLKELTLIRYMNLPEVAADCYMK